MNTSLTAAHIKQAFGDANDITFTDILVSGNKDIPATLIYVQGMVNSDMVNAYILKPLNRSPLLADCKTSAQAIETINTGAVYHLSRKTSDAPGEVIDDILSGYTAVVFDDIKQAVLFETKGFERRSIAEPTEENVLKGPKDAFIEALRVNTALIRRRIKSASLRVVEQDIGSEATTAVSIIYLDGVAEPELVKRILKQVQNIKLDMVKATNSVEEQIIDHKYSLFPQMVYTERPDKLCANILEGKVGLLIDGYPVAYILPSVFNMFFQSPEDYSKNYIHGSLMRTLRYTAAFVSLILPAFYISITGFHQELIPTQLLLSIIMSKLSVPFSSILEVIFILVAFEILLEAGVRMPRSIGQAVSIVGGLVIGDAAVNAKFVSPAVVVVIAITAICGLITPNQDLTNSFNIIRLLLVFCAGFAGLYGLFLGTVGILYYLCTLTSFGVPIMQTYKSKNGGMLLKDGIFRIPSKYKE